MSIDVRALNQLDDPLFYSTEENDPTLRTLQRNRTRKQPGEWEEVYFQRLCEGKTKDVAAALAGVTRQAPYLRRKSDVYFAEMEYASVQIGTAELLDEAKDVIKKRTRGYERVLIHLLSHRGVNAKTIVETSGPNGGPQQVEVNGGGAGSLNIDAMAIPVDVKRAVVERMNEIEAMLAPYRGDTTSATNRPTNGSDTGSTTASPVRVLTSDGVLAARPRPLVRLPV